MFVGETGVVTNHHFLLPEDAPRILFIGTTYRVEVFARCSETGGINFSSRTTLKYRATLRRLSATTIAGFISTGVPIRLGIFLT